MPSHRKKTAQSPKRQLSHGRRSSSKRKVRDYVDKFEGQDASIDVAFAADAVASTVLGWWNQGGIECAIHSCDNIDNAEQGSVVYERRSSDKKEFYDFEEESSTSEDAGEADITVSSKPKEAESQQTTSTPSPRTSSGRPSVDMHPFFYSNRKSVMEAKDRKYSAQTQAAQRQSSSEHRNQQGNPSVVPDPADAAKIVMGKILAQANQNHRVNSAKKNLVLAGAPEPTMQWQYSSSVEDDISPSELGEEDDRDKVPAKIMVGGKLLDREIEKAKHGYKSSGSSITDTASSMSSSSHTLESIHKRGQELANKWEDLVLRNGDFIARIIGALAREAAKNPYITIFSMATLSFALLAIGFFTNFSLVLDNSLLWPPSESFSVHQAFWLYEQTAFTYDFRNVDMVVHANGDNVLTAEGISRVFAALGAVQGMPDYQEGCKWADLVGDTYQVGECHVHSVGNFWNNTPELFQEQSLSDEDVQDVLSTQNYPSGQVVDVPRVIGNAQTDENGNLVFAQSFLIEFDLPWSNDTREFEWYAVEEVLALQSEWDQEDNNPFRLEVMAYRSYEDEFLRAIWLDLPLLPAAFIVVSIFCCLVFWRKDKVHSRTLLGVGAVVTIVFSVMTSFGLMFLCGVPFTTSTPMLPFLIFGIGLDDSFIIIGSYNRTRGTNILKRIEWTMKDVSVSIFITTLTSAFAFALGCFSDIPSVRWLCIYACPAFAIDFIFQITFFIALIVLDERRIQANRRDCCFCVEASYGDEENENLEASWRTPTPPSLNKHWTDRFMGWYADKLLRPVPQALVLVAFFALLAGSIKACSQLEQHFDMNDMVPQDSYLRAYYSSIRQYSKTRNGVASYAFFRDVDQSDKDVQGQMMQFLDDLSETGAIAAPPVNFWLHDFLQFTNQSDIPLTNATFNEQIDLFLKDPLYNVLYDDHITRNDEGELVHSRCEIYINVDVSNAKGGINALERLRNVSKSQPINQGLGGDDWKMFTYQDMYNLWEFYKEVLSELSQSTIIGVIAVCVVGLLLIPHWSAVLFVAPMIVCLYIDMLGYISYTNVHVNAISYVQLVMSIGLMVDFIMHILMRYYECKGTRKERVKETLQTMGSSIFVGGVSSLLGVCLLAFSTSEILRLVFVAVLGLVILGILHGLVFLPVILSLIGPL